MSAGGLIALLVVASFAMIGTVSADRAPSPPAAQASPATVSDRELAWLPGDAGFATAIDIARLRSTGVWKDVIEPKLVDGLSATLGDLDRRCGLRPLATVERVVIGTRKVQLVGGDHVGDDDRETTLIVRGVPRAKALTCVAKLAKQLRSSHVTAERMGDVVVATQDDHPLVAFTFVDDTTLLAVFGPTGTAAGIKQALARRLGIDRAPGFASAYAKLDSSRTVWFWNDGRLGSLTVGDAPVKPRLELGTIDVTDHVAMDVQLWFRASDRDLRRPYVRLLHQEIAQWFDHAEATEAGERVEIASIASARENIDVLVDFAIVISASLVQPASLF